MPTYEYRCNACGLEFELFQSITAPVKRKCPKCSKPKLERLIGTGAGIIFKGGGFYQTDYRSDSYKKGGEAEKKSTEPAKESAATESTAKKSDSGAASDSKSTASPSSDATGGKKKPARKR